MSIKEFIKRKPIHTHPLKKSSTKDTKEVALRYDDPFQWCNADQDLIDDPIIYIDFDDSTDTIQHITVEGKEVF